MTKLAGGREGDWKCSGCGNRNYAFRSLCNRCKQPRLLVDHDTPPESKWLPRIGDWICAGCSNNNYASREKCNKCGKLKASAALPAASLSGAVVPFTVTPFPPSMPFGSIGTNIGMALPMPATISSNANFPYNSSNIMDSNGAILAGGWRPNDWICSCGFVNYASRTVCKQCCAPSPAMATTALQTSSQLPYPGCGSKRHASEDENGEWSSKRQHIDQNQLTPHPFPLNGGIMDDGSLVVTGHLTSSTLNSVSSGFNIDTWGANSQAMAGRRLDV
ncbi:hypothetical protein O6H91_04G034700 [Diphasiastrum complanatum]|uniref:Uncharacterized protein n=1 Tax=Diphasiastrum complanatum TaxID=34168 RepID=A0ACC2DVQ3_DIPCM|nr:hypothetical protein O6H91_04G034700 [Diphasiastrum complanatum]